MIVELCNYAFLIQKLIETPIGKKPRIDDYTELLGISRISLNKFVEQFYFTITHLLKQRLLIKINDCPIRSENDLSRNGYMLNFSHQSYYSNLVKCQMEGDTTTLKIPTVN